MADMATEWAMNRYERIHGCPAILPGKPAIRGSLPSAAFPLGPSIQRWTAREIPERHPHISRHAMRAVFAFVAERGVAFPAHVRDGRSA